ncbi:hypothetical protein INS90_09320 [Trueperella pecoris]|uniref:Uncharacterized protein n=1 Tax=Trueperella pecoris TaxID=2733571 RepID=A0A7M1QZW5_9ACTO|nr:hypothetical protein [Trueperella pecoris]QOR47433.1 hypothetical protein INS90_09320 [Trueperella pecoris]
MGIEGAVVAVGALFLMVYVVPQITRKRAVLADAPIGERYSEDLRLITGRTLNQASGEHGRIFTTERTMSTPTRRTGTRGPDAAKMRAIARDRSRARARIAQRSAYQQRGLAGGVALVALAVILWILAGTTSLSSGFAIATTAAGGVYLVGFGYLVSAWSSLNADDDERISKANKALRAGKMKPDAPAKTAETVERAPHDDVVKRAPDPVDAAADAAKGATKGTAKETTVARTAAVAEAREPRLARPTPRPVEAPSYTLKPTRRTVKPYVAPEAPEAEVPFRPTQLRERLGDAQLEAPHAAPEMTGAEELRSDVLGGGSTLDALLDRRRA